jgi:hypothetical protein
MRSRLWSRPPCGSSGGSAGCKRVTSGKLLGSGPGLPKGGDYPSFLFQLTHDLSSSALREGFPAERIRRFRRSVTKTSCAAADVERRMAFVADAACGLHTPAASSRVSTPQNASQGLARRAKGADSARRDGTRTGAAKSNERVPQTAVTSPFSRLRPSGSRARLAEGLELSNPALRRA